MLRLDLIEDLQNRLRQISEKESSTLRMAKICSEKARQDIEEKYREPKEKLQLHYEMLDTKLTVQLTENAATFQQLVKYRTEVNQDIEELTRKMELEAQTSESLLTELESQLEEYKTKLSELTEELATVTIHYEQIIEEKRKRMEIREKQRLELLRREKAAILIQRWYRLQCLRRASRRKKKLKRFKPSANSKQEQATGSTKKRIVGGGRPSIKKTAPKSDASKKIILHSKNRKEKNNQTDSEIKEEAIQVTDRCSQTDDRIPVSEKTPVF